jgi:hypothetical protein
MLVVGDAGQGMFQILTQGRVESANATLGSRRDRQRLGDSERSRVDVGDRRPA